MIFMHRSTFFLSLAIIISTSMILAFINAYDRFIMSPLGKEVFIFDRKNKILNVCSSDGCKIMPYLVDNQINLPTTMAAIPEVSSVAKIDAKTEKSDDKATKSKESKKDKKSDDDKKSSDSSNSDSLNDDDAKSDDSSDD